MSCDLSDPNLLSVYQEVLNKESPTNWMICGYRDTRDIIYFYEKGTKGFEELQKAITSKQEVLYAFFKLEKKFYLLTFINEEATGVKRARALVHGRAIGNLFKENEASLTVTSKAEVTEASIRTKLRLPPFPTTLPPPAPPKDVSLSDSELDKKREVKENIKEMPVISSVPQISTTPRKGIVSGITFNYDAQEGKEKRESQLRRKSEDPPFSPTELYIDEEEEREEDFESEVVESETTGASNTLTPIIAIEPVPLMPISTPLTPLTPSKAEQLPSPVTTPIQRKLNGSPSFQELEDSIDQEISKSLLQQQKSPKGNTQWASRAVQPSHKSPQKPLENSPDLVTFYSQATAQAEAYQLGQTVKDTSKLGLVTELLPQQYWKRRFFLIQKNFLYLLNIETMKIIHILNLNAIQSVQACENEIVVLNSLKFKMDGHDGDGDFEAFFYLDTKDLFLDFQKQILQHL